MVLDPIDAANPDLKPADYRHLGFLEIEKGQGKIQRLELFYPLGHFKREGKYYITDFTEMKKLFKRVREMELKRILEE
jgi:hypothetical protein